MIIFLTIFLFWTVYNMADNANVWASAHDVYTPDKREKYSIMVKNSEFGTILAPKSMFGYSNSGVPALLVFDYIDDLLHSQAYLRTT